MLAAVEHQRAGGPTWKTLPRTLHSADTIDMLRSRDSFVSTGQHRNRMSFGFKAAIVQQHAFSERLNDNIGDDRDLVNALIHKYDPVPMSGIKALSDKKAMKTLAELMCFEE